VISDRATLSLVAEDVVTQRVVSNRLRRGLTRREINEQYVRNSRSGGRIQSARRRE